MNTKLDTHRPLAPPWRVSRWFNAPRGFRGLPSLRGRVVVLHAFQMLCPGCVSHAIPQAKRIQDTFGRDDVSVLGLHTVFEHHAVMTESALEVFLHEYGITFPVGVDMPSTSGPVPETMQAYGLRGTPSTLLFDRAGRLVSQTFGRLDDMTAGAVIASLISDKIEGTPAPDLERERDARPVSRCDDGVCAAPR